MKQPTFTLPVAWPDPYDGAAADRLLERIAALGRAEARMAAQPAARAMLRCIGGNSPFLSDLALREAATLRRLVVDGPDAVVGLAMAALAAIKPSAARERVVAGLRAAKRVVALTTALADIGGLWVLEQVTTALSDLAEAALRLSVAHLLRSAHDQGELMLPDPDNPAQGGGFTVLGMGKLGARELNYSSDVDLVLLYDPAAPIYTERSAGDAMGGFTTRLARGLVSLMEARDADGYVFRTDLRLRPDPAATPPAIALPAAISYYESMGQNWERAAMIKARPVAGDLALGAGFLEAIRPFVWRRGLDFAAVADIHAMKRRIDKHRGGSPPRAASPVAGIAGYNVKLGEGGIREVEFLVQTLQLVWGGREPGLRLPVTLDALHLLVRAGRVPRASARELEAAYRFLRQVEHRLQMVADRQTHDVPERTPDIERIAMFMGYNDASAFATELLNTFTRVRARYAEVFEMVPDLPDSGGSDLDFRGDGPAPPETIAALRGFGFLEPERIVAAVRGWQTGRVRALRSMRARDLIGSMLPAILSRIGGQSLPDETFSRFDRFLAAQPAGVQLLSLFQRNPSLLDRIVAVLGAAPFLAEHLARHAAALEGLLLPDESNAARHLKPRLADARDLEEIIDVTRRAVKEADFSISVATMEGRLDADSAGIRRSDMAVAALAAMLPPVLADFASRFGRVRGGDMAVVALGKAGGQEMMAGSDLDLMLIYDHPDHVTESSGGRSLPVSQWFVRAAHAYVAALTSPGVEGQMYAIDMRLRPSGNKGPVAVSLSGFRRYHAESAWTWERMALTRARVVAGKPALRKKIADAIEQAIRSGDPTAARADAAAMRRRMLRDLPQDGPWDVKLRPGGLVEVEFIAQALQVAHAAEFPEIRSQTARIALRRLADAGLLPREDAALLIHADHVWRTVQGMLRIVVGRATRDTLPEAPGRMLLRAVQATGEEAVDLPALRAILDGLAQQVRLAFERHIGDTKA